jgi:hypothetical protein
MADFEISLSREPVHRHRSPDAVGGAPEVDVTLVKHAGIERKENGVAAANAREIGEVG